MIPVADKIALVDCLSGAGFRRIEVASFCRPKWVPQMADGAEVLAGITRAPGVSYARTDPEHEGVRARYGGAGRMRSRSSARPSEGFSQANINASIADSLATFAPLVAEAAGARLAGAGLCVLRGRMPL